MRELCRCAATPLAGGTSPRPPPTCPKARNRFTPAFREILLARGYHPRVVRRLVRILFNALTLLSLLLCLAAVGVWIRSYWWIDHYYSEVITGTQDNRES